MRKIVPFLLILLWTGPTWAVGDADFFKMIEQGDVAGVKSALAEGWDLNAGDDFSGTTPLMRAVIEEQSEIVELLLSAGADPDALSSNGLAPLERALMFRLPGSDTKIMELLIEAGADLETRDSNYAGTTLLFHPAERGDTQTTRLLLKAGAVSEANARGLTPLHLATGLMAMEMEGRNTGTFSERAARACPGSDFSGTARALVEAGADVDAVCMGLEEPDMPEGLKKILEPFGGKTPLDFARTLGNQEVAAYLEGVGARTAAELQKR